MTRQCEIDGKFTEYRTECDGSALCEKHWDEHLDECRICAGVEADAFDE